MLRESIFFKVTKPRQRSSFPHPTYNLLDHRLFGEEVLGWAGRERAAMKLHLREARQM